MSDVLTQLYQTLESRKKSAPESSYVASLYQAGNEKILKKLGEEATETIIATMQGDKSQITYEMADLWFHSLVLLAHNDIPVEAILAELQRRTGVSGLEEKANRGQKS